MNSGVGGDHVVTRIAAGFGRMAGAARAVRLSKRTVDAALAEAERYVLWDTDLKGFGIRVTPEGTKSFVVRYRSGGGRRGTSRQFLLGKFGPVTADQARDQAKRILAGVLRGEDPQAVRREQRAEPTLAEFCDTYLVEGCATKKASTLYIDRIRIARHIKPVLGKKQLSKIRREDVERLMLAIANGETRDLATPHTRGGKAAAARTVGLLGGILEFAVQRRLIAENPVRGVKRYADKQRDRFLSQEELGRLGAVLEAISNQYPEHTKIIRLLLLTGARKNEIAQLQWSAVKLDRGCLDLEDSKTGRKTIRLGAAAISILQDTLRTKSPFVFPDPRDATLPIRGLDWAWVNIRREANLSEVRIHDLRHTFASMGLVGGQGLYMIGKLLGHSHVATTSRYTHLSNDPVASAADDISAMMATAMSSATT